MKVVNYKVVEDCYEANNVIDLKLDSIITNPLVIHLSKLGKLIYQYNIENPYFKIIIKGLCTIKGSENSNIIRILFPDEEYNTFLQEFIKIISDFNEN